MYQGLLQDRMTCDPVRNATFTTWPKDAATKKKQGKSARLCGISSPLRTWDVGRVCGWIWLLLVFIARAENLSTVLVFLLKDIPAFQRCAALLQTNCPTESFRMSVKVSKDRPALTFIWPKQSYAKRTVIEGFDPMFNAITGLNGSGKSNILDSICFVLGISRLEQV